MDSSSSIDIVASEKLKTFEDLCREAVRCRHCFGKDSNLTAATIDIAQPRWIGPDYWCSPRRILILMLNPGSGEARRDSADQEARRLIAAFRYGAGSLQEILKHQREDMPRWGRGGRFLPFYTVRLGLSCNELAFANVAWCATLGNKYPRKMLNACYSRHTRRLLSILKPHVVLLSGGPVHKFKAEIENLLPSVHIYPMLNHAHRKKRNYESQEGMAVRRFLRAVQIDSVK
jgi:hypothetical protein